MGEEKVAQGRNDKYNVGALSWGPGLEIQV